MRKILLIFAFLPLALFGSFEYNGYTIDRMRVYTWTSFGTTIKTQNALTVYPISEESLSSALASSSFGFAVNTSLNNSSRIIVPTPTLASMFVSVNLANKTTITNSIYATTSSNGNFAVSAHYFPSLSSIYNAASVLYLSGYRGSGVLDDFQSGTFHCVNVNFPLLLADVLSSTNTVFRQILLGHLNSIQQSVANIEINMSGVQSAVEQGNASLSNINFVASDIRDIVHTNFVAVSNISESVSTISSNSFDILRGVDLLHDDWLASSIDVFLGDDTDAWVNFLNMAVEQGLLSEYDASQYASTLRATDPTRKKSFSIPDAHRRFFAKNSIKGTVVEAQQMRGRYQTFQNWTNQRGVMFGAMDSTWNAVAGDRINSIIGSHVGDWRSELRQQLQDWKHSDETGILNVRESISNSFSDVSNYLTNQVASLGTFTNAIQDVTNRIGDVCGHVDAASSNIAHQVSDSTEDMRKFLDENFRDGIKVKIIEPQNHMPGCVSVWDPQLSGLMDSIGAWADVTADGWTWLQSGSLTANVDFDWQPWFDKFDPYSSNVVWFIERYRDAESFHVGNASQSIFGTGFDEDAFDSLPWFNRVELLLYQIHLALANTNYLSTADIETNLTEQVDGLVEVGEDFHGVSTNVVGLFGFVDRFGQSVKLAFQNSAAPSTDGIVLLDSGDWLVDEPLVLRIPIEVQNALRLVMQCIWYLSALVIGWRIVVVAWDKVVSLFRWLWSILDI